ncbi:MAG: hypothetical protein KGI33_08710 [Thaumarchaeota archaeon]|nr:hypothetical protein [Nitrososphaerota archaeon]
MKTLHIMLIVGISISMIITAILLLQNSSLQQQIDSRNNVMNSGSILDEYEKQFGNITLGYDPPHVSLDGKIYIIEGIGSVNTNVEPNSTYTIKTNHNYLIQAHFTRKYDIKPSLIYYVCHLQILNSTNQLVMSEWGDITLIPKQNSSNCALQWIPTKVGNYTAQAFATEDEIGSAPLLSSPATIHIQILS